MSYAIIKLGGKQYKVAEKDKLVIDKLPHEEGSEFVVTDVLLTQDDKKAVIGTPLVEKASVTLRVMRQFKGDKLRVATYKSKSRHRRAHGHRQHLSKIEVMSVTIK